MNLKRRKCKNISEMFQACVQLSETQSTKSRPPTRGDDSIHTPPPTIGLADVTPTASPHIDEANVAAHSNSVCSDSICSLPSLLLSFHFAGSKMGKNQRSVVGRISDALYNARQKWFAKCKLVDWIDLKVMDKLVKYWEPEDFKNRSTLNKTNRNRVTSDGRGVAKSNGGSRSTYDTKLFLAIVQHDELHGLWIVVRLNKSCSSKMY